MSDTNSIRILVRGNYDLQKLRIMTGNRIVATFKAKLGQAPGQREDELDDEGKKLLDHLRLSYRKLTDGVKRELPAMKSFKGDALISTYTELVLLHQYVGLENSEAQQFRTLGTVLREYPLYTGFLEPIKGIGPAMAGVLISEIDIHKATYPSSLWKFCGLDVVVHYEIIDAEGEITKFSAENLANMIEKGTARLTDTGEAQLYDAAGDEWITLKAVYSGRSRRTEHLVLRDYIAKDGTQKQRLGITFSPWLKTKLYVLAGSFLKANSDPYRKYYDDYKHRLQHRPDWADETDGHRHNAAMRYMLKRFLVDLYKFWRPLEGLSVASEYSEGKLGMIHGRAKVA